ncbi:MAG TPA: zinc ribbon domain-containing protein [Terriglobia bacterium]|nr:zinc ribbon domain-containing protein [Terriglobia bacterium]
MPIYEYRCKKCGKQFEKIQKFDDPPLKKHEECGGALEQLLHAPAIQFKGSGFYITDYARKSAPSESTGSGSSSDAGSKSGDGGSKTSETTSKASSKKTESKTPAASKKD